MCDDFVWDCNVLSEGNFLGQCGQGKKDELSSELTFVDDDGIISSLLTSSSSKLAAPLASLLGEPIILPSGPRVADLSSEQC